MKLSLAMAAVLMAGAPLVPGAHAQRAVSLHATTAGQLADLCAANSREPRGDARINYCHGFAQGALDVILHDAGDRKPFCLPTPAPTRTATLNDFVRWVRADSEHAGYGAAEGLYRFMRARYPCNG